MKSLYAIFALLLLGFLGLGCQEEPNFELLPEQDVFAQSVKYNNKIDILWVIDNSRSMEKYQRDILQQAAHYMERLDSLGWDYRIGVTTTDYSQGGTGGQLIGSTKYITPAEVDRVSEFQSRILQGEQGSNREVGLQSIHDLLTNEVDFVRPEAFLVINMVSDEEDYSTVSTAEVVDMVDDLKKTAIDFKQKWLFHFMGVISDQGSCRTFDAHASVGTKYMSLAEDTGGLTDNICERDFRRALDGFFDVVITEILTEYTLTRLPRKDSIRVVIDGEEVAEDATNGWSYDEEKNLIRFSGDAIPRADSYIQVDYRPLTAS